MPEGKKVVILPPEFPIMRKHLKYVCIFLFFLNRFMVLEAQDPGFSQFYGNPVFLNPALAGNKLCPRLTLNYRNQWPSIPASFVTYSASYDQFVDALSGGVALLVVSDRAGRGMLSNNSFSGVYAYRLNASQHITVNAGFQATFQQYSMDWNKLVFASDLDGDANTSEPRDNYELEQTIADFSTGFVIGYRESYYLGLAAHHLTQPLYAFDTLNSNGTMPMKLTIHAGAIFNLYPGAAFQTVESIPTISPNILYQQQGEFRQLNVGFYMNFHPFTGGLWLRHNFDPRPDAAIMLLGFEHENLKIGYSYDYTLSRLTNATGGAHEISISYTFACIETSARRERIRAIKCPGF
jgi:type IX secretion system PorP/SprF family membrane protein